MARVASKSPGAGGRREPLVLLVLGGVLSVAVDALAGDPITGRIDIEARLEPKDLAPGQGGTLILEGTLLPKLHIYATGEQAMTYAPVEAARSQARPRRASRAPRAKTTNIIAAAPPQASPSWT